MTDESTVSPGSGGSAAAATGGPNAGVAGTRTTRRAPWIAGAVAVVVAAMLVLFALSPSDAERPESAPLVGREAPDINAKDTTGATFSLADYRGAWVLLNFFAEWCGPCKLEQPELISFANAHDGSAYVVSVSYNDKPDTVRKFFAENGGDWPVIAEGNAQIALDYGVIKLPESYLIDPNGIVRVKFNGGIVADEVDALIAKMEGTK